MLRFGLLVRLERGLMGALGRGLGKAMGRLGKSPSGSQVTRRPIRRKLPVETHILRTSGRRHTILLRISGMGITVIIQLGHGMVCFVG